MYDALNNESTENNAQKTDNGVVSSTARWHQNTEKVFAMLKRSIAAPNCDASSNTSYSGETKQKPNHIMFDSISKGASRRTVVGVFFELLQLKTWDYIDVEQVESYGNIKILPGLKFQDVPPGN